jgi:uncharacterized OsmC-like protein
MSDQSFINGVNVDGLKTTIRAIRQEPPLGMSHFRARNRWMEGGLNQTSIQDFYVAGQEDTSRDAPFELDADEPPVLFGENRGPNPVEYALTALLSCLTSSMVYHAAARGIRIEELESEVEGDIDLRGFLGLDPNVRKGYQNIRVNFRVRSDASPEQLKELALFSPVFDTMASPVPIALNVQKSEVLEPAAAG